MWGVLPAVLLIVAFLLAGCGDTGTLIKDYTRSGDGDEGEFIFNVGEGVKRLQIHFSTEGTPESAGAADLELFRIEGQNWGGADLIYMGSLGHGDTDTQIVDDPKPGQYLADLDFNEYTGPASVEVRSVGGAATSSPGGSVLADQFWEILGIVLTLGVAVGGWLLYRHHTKRLDREIKRIDETFKSLRSDAVDCRKRLLQMEEEFQQQLLRNKLKEGHFLILEKRIERYLQDLKERWERGGLAEMPLELE